MTTNREILTDIQVKVGKIEEHLQNLNKSTQRNEKDINNIYTKVNTNSVAISKIMGFFIAVGTVAGLVGAFIFKVISKLLGK